MTIGVWDNDTIDSLVQERNIGGLVRLIRNPDYLSPDVRDHLADVIHGLLSRRTKFPKRRPRKPSLSWDRKEIGERVWVAKKSKGLKKVSSAVVEVAKELHCSTRTVWSCWAGFDPLGYELRWEKRAHDAEVSAYHEARWEAAIERLADEHGSEREFTDDEIEAEAKELDDCRDYDDY